MTNKNLQQDHCSSIAMHWWWLQELSRRLLYVICIVCFDRDIHYKAIQHFRFSCTKYFLSTACCPREGANRSPSPSLAAPVVVLHTKWISKGKKCMIFFMYARTLHVCIFTIKLRHDFTVNLSHKSSDITCLTISGHYPVNRWVNTKISDISVTLIVKSIDIRTNPSPHTFLLALHPWDFGILLEYVKDFEICHS